MSDIKEIKEENINSVSGGLLVNDDSKRQGWHCVNVTIGLVIQACLMLMEIFVMNSVLCAIKR